MTEPHGNEMAPDDMLPQVAGSLDCSLADFERSCRVCILDELQTASPNNAVIAVLCNAVRLKREYVRSKETQ